MVSIKSDNDRLESIEYLDRVMRDLKRGLSIESIVEDSDKRNPTFTFCTAVDRVLEDAVMFEDMAKRKDPDFHQQMEAIRRVFAQSVELILNASDLPKLTAKSDIALFVELANQATHLKKTVSAPRESFRARRAMLLLEGKIRFEKLLSDAGGVYTLEEVKSLLKTSTDAVRKRIERHTLIGRRDEFPTWQFDNRGRLIREIQQVLQSLKHTDYVGKCLFFLTPCDDLDGKSPKEALTTGTQAQRIACLQTSKRLASQFLEQGAR